MNCDLFGITEASASFVALDERHRDYFWAFALIKGAIQRLTARTMVPASPPCQPGPMAETSPSALCVRSGKPPEVSGQTVSASGIGA